MSAVLVHNNRNTKIETTTITTTKYEEKMKIMDTVLFFGTDFTRGKKGDISFVDQLQEKKLIHAMKFCSDDDVTLTKRRNDNNYIDMLTSLPVDEYMPAYVMIEIPYGDIKRHSKIGEISDGAWCADFDTKTLIGAMEYIVIYCRDTWGCPVGFYTGYYPEDEDYQKLIDAMNIVAEKWKVDTIDFCNSPSITINDDNKKEYLASKHYPTAQGYKEFFTPMVEVFFVEAFL